MNSFDWDRGFVLDFDKNTGISTNAEITKRYLSQMKNMYHDSEAVTKMLKDNDPLIYEFYELGCEERAGDIAFGTTILYPGKIGDEYYMTKGHFHTKLNTSEVYYTLSGQGAMVMENPEGDTKVLPLLTGQCVYVPRRYAHRTVNTGKEPLVVFWAFDADAGHDYGTIETKGYHKIIIEKNGNPVTVMNPKWV